MQNSFHSSDNRKEKKRRFDPLSLGETTENAQNLQTVSRDAALVGRFEDFQHFNRISVGLAAFFLFIIIEQTERVSAFQRVNRFNITVCHAKNRVDYTFS